MNISLKPCGAQTPLPSFEGAFGPDALPFDMVDAWELIQRLRRRRRRRPSLSRLAARAKRDGVEVSVALDGTITYRPLPVAPPSAGDDRGTELDAWIAKHAR